MDSGQPGTRIPGGAIEHPYPVYAQSRKFRAAFNLMISGIFIIVCMPSRIKYLAVSGSYDYGHTIARRHLRMAKIRTLTAAADIHPFDRLLLETSVHFTKANDLDTDVELYNGYTVWSRLNYQFSRGLFCQTAGTI